ncbi:hypothetical protein CC86DRAFT_48833 [Ophiobolus disseminans]|uniref:Uncharacterized protein n=1 Tax=Ophiobolus disseminans TaxID=1469910 RepID=A0A6A6ZW29_9PLEO|nr:hypothetical protein CC86DRAFT_48833 [Ophiobolus disseminans]
MFVLHAQVSDTRDVVDGLTLPPPIFHPPTSKRPHTSIRPKSTKTPGRPDLSIPAKTQEKEHATKQPHRSRAVSKYTPSERHLHRS